MERLLTEPGTFKCKVSSTMPPASQFASKHMFDGNADSCWNSDQGTPQFVTMDFLKNVIPSRVVFVFQGGFVGQECTVEVGSEPSSLVLIKELHHLKDINDEQSFELQPPGADLQGRILKISFRSSTDFYGRVTLYKLDVYGVEV